MSQPPPMLIVDPADVRPGDRRQGASAGRPAYRRRQAERADRRGPVNIGLWIPTTVIFALLAPFALLATPFLYLAPRDIIPDPPRAVFGLGAVLFSLSGTVVDVDTPDARIRLHLF